jgi:tetratricopeptide (TPR) repeat protein
MPKAVRILALLGLGLAATATPVAAQGPLARTYAAYGFSALASGDFGAAIREFTGALERYPLYVDAYVGRAMASIAQDRLLEAWDDLQRAKRYDDDPARQASIDELLQGVEVTLRLASYAAFLTGTKRDDDAVQVAGWANRFRATLYTLPPEESTALDDLAPHEVLKQYAAELRALGRQAEASQTEALADAYLGHQMENWRRQREEYEKEM